MRVVQTPASLDFVGRATFEGVTGAPVLVDEFEPDPARGAYPGRAAARPRPDLAPRAGAPRRRFCVAPASANTIAKLADGLADNLLTSAALAVHRAAGGRARDEQPHVRAPGHAGQPRAAARPRRDVVEPGTRPARLEAASGAWAGWPSPRDDPRRRRGALGRRGGFAPRSLDGLRVLVTAGGTREPIDSVRYVGNRSSGRMGLALAAEAAARGAEVTVVAANVSLPAPAGVAVVDVETAAELRDAAGARVRATPTCC